MLQGKTRGDGEHGRPRPLILASRRNQLLAPRELRRLALRQPHFHQRYVVGEPVGAGAAALRGDDEIERIRRELSGLAEQFGKLGKCHVLAVGIAQFVGAVAENIERLALSE